LSEAEYCYQEALQREPDHFDALQLLGVLRFRSGDLASGIELLQRALRLQPNHAPALNNLGNALRAAGRLTEALGAYQQAATRANAPNAMILRNLGSAFLECGELAQAGRYLGEAFRIAPQDPVLCCWIGHLQRGLECPKEAVQAYQHALRLDPRMTQ